MFQKNLEYLKKKFPDLYKAVTGPDQIAGVEIEVQQSKNGQPVARVGRNERRLYLNSPYDPETEARRSAEKYAAGEARCALLYGAGFFYHLKSLLDLDCFKKIAIYEPDPRILKACMSYIDLQPLLENPKVFLVTGNDYNNNTVRVMQFLQNDLINSAENLEVITPSSYRELYPVELEQFQLNLKEQIRVTQINLTTLDLWGRVWLKNALKLFNSAVSSPVIRHYFGRFKSIPAIIVSAGPSLEKNIHLIKELKEKAVILCAGSSLRAMRRHQVTPHFLVGIDSGEICGKIFGDLDLTGIDLIYSLRFWQGTVNNFPGKRILMKLDAESLPQVLIEGNGGYEIGMVSSGFSCSHVCLDLAFKLGCNPIILIGQDLAYTSNKRYAEGQLETHQEYLQSTQLPPKCFIAKDINGEDIVTERGLDGIRVIFEKNIASLYKDKVTIINATEGGIPIKGAPNRKLAEVISEYCREDRGVTGKIAAIYEQGLKELEKRRIDPIKYCSKLKVIMERAVHKLSELVDKLQVIRRFNFSSAVFDPSQFERELEAIASGYDQTLNYHEYHAFLKELQATALSINKIRLDEYRDVKTKEEFDQKLLVYLNIILETKKHLDFIITCINDYLEEQGVVQTQPLKEKIDHGRLNALETKIKAGEELPEIQKVLQSGLNEADNTSRGWYLYLLGRLAVKAGRKDQAVNYLEQAVLIDKNMTPAYFQLFKLYHAGRDHINALRALEHCRRLDFKSKYCLRMQIKAHYATKNYVAANNLIREYLPEYGSVKWIEALRVDCLQHLNLFSEASDAYQRLLSQYRLSPPVKTYLAGLITNKIQNSYEETYQKNRAVFRSRDIDLPDYPGIRYKICRYLSGEFVYDRATGKLLPGVNQAPQNRMPVNEDDVLAIYNPSDTKIFERLAEIIKQDDLKKRELTGLIPVFVIERDAEQWPLLAQLFDFQLLADWTNLHFYIAPSDQELEKIFSDEKTPFPNVLHGTGLAEFEQMLTKVKSGKEQCFQQRLNELRDYYRTYRAESPKKVLVVASRKNEVLLFYGKMLHEYLLQIGIDSVLHTEPVPYHRFTIEDDARVLHEFRPDLVIHLFGVQEELAVYKELNIPFVSWLLIEKQFSPDLAPVCSRQKILYTGNLDAIRNLVQRGYSQEIMLPVGIPVSEAQTISGDDESCQDGIGIFGDLEDFETIIINLTTIISGLLGTFSAKVTRQKITDILEAIYFWMRSNLPMDKLSGLDFQDYQRVIAENLARYHLNLAENELGLLASLIKKELEDYYFKRLQVSWVLECFQHQNVRIYGSGWERDEQYKAFFQENLSPLIDWERFGEVVTRNKINICLGNRLNNKSYMQLELIYGMALGGLFITNDLLVQKYGDNLLGPFNGNLELYHSKKEILDMIGDYLVNDQKRVDKINKITAYMKENFSIGKIKHLLC